MNTQYKLLVYLASLLINILPTNYAYASEEAKADIIQIEFPQIPPGIGVREAKWTGTAYHRSGEVNTIYQRLFWEAPHSIFQSKCWQERL